MQAAAICVDVPGTLEEVDHEAAGYRAVYSVGEGIWKRLDTVRAGAL
jgi:hypothetical protein